MDSLLRRVAASSLLALALASAGAPGAGAAPHHRAGHAAISRQRLVASAGPAAGKPLLLIVPGGGFVSYFDDSMWARRMARGRGFAVRRITYPLFDPLAAWHRVRDEARRLARRGRSLYAYGESAGGTLAALLAERCLVRAATVNAPVSDLTSWSLPGYPGFWESMRNAGPRTRALLSPALHPSARPILVQQSPTDKLVPAAMNLGWAARDARVGLREYQGDHVLGVDLTSYVENVREALGFLDRVRFRLRAE